MIRTRQSRIPWLWVVSMLTTTAAFSLADRCSNTALTFSLRKFTDDPALIAFIGSINIAFNFLVAPYVSWKSDRIWTRWGRRRPFLLSGFLLLALALLTVPFAPSLLALTAIVVVWQFAADWGYTGAWSPLLYETVPTHQRGRTVVLKSVLVWPVNLLFNLVLIGQFDNVYPLEIAGATATITGEHVIYGLAALFALYVVVNIGFFVRETPPDKVAPRERFRPMTYLREVFGERQFRLIYLLLVVSMFMSAGMGQLAPLLYTEQWGYTKQEFGLLKTAQMFTGICIVVPVAMLIIDRFDRFRLFLVMLGVSTIHPLLFWLFIKFVAPGQVPSMTWIIAFSVLDNIADVAAGYALEPYFFDITPRSKMGTMNSGFLLVRGIMAFILGNAVAWWIKGYSALFGNGEIDYTSGLLWVFCLGVLGCVGALYFESQRRQGAIVMYGKLEAEAEAIAAEDAKGADDPDASVLRHPAGAARPIAAAGAAVER